MFRRLFLFRRLLATTFLVVFVNVFVGQCYCKAVQPAASGRAAGKSAAQPQPMKPGHGCCQAAARKAQSASDQAAKSHQSRKHSGAGGCCKNKAASLLSSLSSPVEKQLFALAPALLPATADFHFRPTAGPWDRTGAVTLVLRQHLPPKIPDIRIFIRSLTV
ncbi:hypothetical protein [Hymenobacter sp.]|uniref:hypothetical protein n=1 Tax=Hymenobacter sp. TaxID=1898978 RepID=UPI002869F834|nr:hypothetical protein [Hymenobacter sp.]